MRQNRGGRAAALLRGAGFQNVFVLDGGIGPDNAPAAREAGCDVLVAASAIFGKPPAERLSVIEAIRGSE